MSGKVIHLAGVWSCLAHGGRQWIVPQRVNWWRGEGKVQLSTSLSCLKEMWVGSAGEAWRLMSQKGALTAFPLVAGLLGGPIGLGCHFCYLILCMWTRLIRRGWGSSGGAVRGAATRETAWVKNVTPSTHSRFMLTRWRKKGRTKTEKEKLF